MVEETVSNKQDYRQLEDPDQELNRAVSDYLHISRTYKYYFSAASYLEAEEKAWNRLQNALNNPELENK
jgi:hypothetical protein